MDHKQEELNELLEKEKVVDKVSQLINLELNNYENMEEEQGQASTAVEALQAMRSELSPSNALGVLEMYLNRDFEHMDATAIRDAAAHYVTS